MAIDNRTEATEKARRRYVAPSGPSLKLAGNESAAAFGVVFATKLTVEPRKNRFVVLCRKSFATWHGFSSHKPHKMQPQMNTDRCSSVFICGFVHAFGCGSAAP